MRIYFLIIIYIVLIFQNYLYSNSLLEENDYNKIIETIEEKEIEEIQNSNIPEKPNIFDKINNRESVRNMILNISLYLENGGGQN